MPSKIIPRLLYLLGALALWPAVVSAQDAPASPAIQSHSDASSADTDANDAPLSLFPHSETSRWWISGQANVVFQWHPSFPAAYTGTNSFKPYAEDATSKVYTLYTGLELTHTTEVFVDIESAGGYGLSSAVGIAGFVNLDVVRNPYLGGTPYLARAVVRQIIPLSHDTMPAERGALGLATSLPARRIEVHAGKFSLVDFFDANSGGSDSHLQFLNWTVDNNGVYDYAANTRGYTDGAVVEYDDHSWTVRFGEAMMPKTANGIHLDADLFRAHSENLEGEWRQNFFPGRAGVIRLLSFVNHANMGNYREAIDEFLAGQDTRPDIIATRRQGRVKYGFGLNLEQDLAKQFGVFARLGWSDGRNESFAYTEVDRTFEIGSYVHGETWRRRYDRAGVAFTLNGISGDHARYLSLGGLGFLLGDGALIYGDEKIFETYYTAHVWRGFYASFDLQRINNPGYNQARGPVLVPGLRLHVDF
ncbi:MAG: carbohydrate porin [Candidatus Acidiferrales bacterium]